MHGISMNSLLEIGLLSLWKYIIQRQGQGQFFILLIINYYYEFFQLLF
jgi:hypothetical protein